MSEKNTMLSVLHAPERLFSYSEFGAIIGVSAQTIMEWVRRGKIASPQYLGSTARFTAEAIYAVKTCGVSEAGTHEVAVSPRAIVGRLGAAARKSLQKRNGRARGVSPRARPKGGKSS
jgi:hypothetical protein